MQVFVGPGVGPPHHLHVAFNELLTVIELGAQGLFYHFEWNLQHPGHHPHVGHVGDIRFALDRYVNSGDELVRRNGVID